MKPKTKKLMKLMDIIRDHIPNLNNDITAKTTYVDDQFTDEGDLADVDIANTFQKCNSLIRIITESKKLESKTKELMKLMDIIRNHIPDFYKDIIIRTVYEEPADYMDELEETLTAANTFQELNVLSRIVIEAKYEEYYQETNV